MIVTAPRHAIITNPARRTGNRLDQPHHRYAQPLEHCRPHRVELYTHGGHRIACLYGEDRKGLEARVGRWRAHVSNRLEARWPTPEP